MKVNLLNIFKKHNPAVLATVEPDTTNYSFDDGDYKLLFSSIDSTHIDVTTISIGAEKDCKLRQNVSIYKTEELVARLNFLYKYQCGSTRDAVKFFRFVAIAFSGYFYLYDLSTLTIVLFLDFNGYFCEFKHYEQHILIVYNSGIYCLTKYGSIKWHNSDIGLDGITISQIENGKVYGSEQIDPPDGWKPFILNFNTGFRLDKNGR